ncbi:hypothetical protein F2A38_23460 [Pseudomonas chlororaphis]|uniref:Uncharacterized protein n=1 Tax=Pseudomonas chlororaphis TaxID=587753 RepID=A0AB34C184_9PSED|nr:hypothetical protein [Pseudomonas chlororaphis]KAA5839809.1 hypothetical protein F2A38_23460 [Pseudomonas chlororaphis]
MTKIIQDEPVMPSPRAGRYPEKSNIYWSARQSSSQLLPLFPFDGPGDIIPTCTSMRATGEGVKIGYFLHTNSVDEVMVSFGSTGQIRTGDVHVGPRTHGVGGWDKAEFFAVLSVTQRQKESGDQSEIVAFCCDSCNAEVTRLEFKGVNPEGQSKYPPLPTILGSAQSGELFNASVESRTCKSCGHVNPPFPLHIWGWQRYVYNTSIVEDARNALDQAAHQ